MECGWYQQHEIKMQDYPSNHAHISGAKDLKSEFIWNAQCFSLI